MFHLVDIINAFNSIKLEVLTSKLSVCSECTCILE
jgi:hypothetical protein